MRSSFAARRAPGGSASKSKPARLSQQEDYEVGGFIDADDAADDHPLGRMGAAASARGDGADDGDDDEDERPDDDEGWTRNSLSSPSDADAEAGLPPPHRPIAPPPDEDEQDDGPEVEATFSVARATRPTDMEEVHTKFKYKDYDLE